MNSTRLVRIPQQHPITSGCVNIRGIIDNPRVFDSDGHELSFAFVYPFDDTWWIILHDNGEGIFESSYSEALIAYGFPQYAHYTNFSRFNEPITIISLDGVPSEIRYESINVELCETTGSCYVFVS